MKEISLGEALRQFRKTRETGLVVNISYMTYSKSDKKSSGVKTVRAARCLAQSKKGKYKSYMIHYIDAITGEHKHFWLPLLMSIGTFKVNPKFK